MPRTLTRTTLHLNTANGVSQDGSRGYVYFDLPDDLFNTAPTEASVWISHLSLINDNDLVDATNNTIAIDGSTYFLPTGRPTMSQCLNSLNEQQSLVVFTYDTAKNQIVIDISPTAIGTVEVDFSADDSCAELLGFERIPHYVSEYGAVYSVFPVCLGVSQMLHIRSNIGAGAWESRADGIVSTDILATIPITAGSFNAVNYTDEIGLHKVLLQDRNRLTHVYLKVCDAHSGKILKLKNDYVVSLTIETTDYNAKRDFERMTQDFLKQIAEFSKLSLLNTTLQ